MLNLSINGLPSLDTINLFTYVILVEGYLNKQYTVFDDRKCVYIVLNK